jgi:N-methylhydantoinase B
LKDAVPDLVCGASNGSNTAAIFSGTDPRTGQPYLYLETLGGGFGGRAGKDGKDGVQVHITNTSNLPIEAIEQEYPLLVDSYELVVDSAGPGRHRGGAGLRRIIRPVGHETGFTGFMERVRHQPWGLFGGGSGASGRFVLRDAKGEETVLLGKPFDVRLGPDQSIVIETPGAGGYGDPTTRDPDLVRREAVGGLFSTDYLARHYGFEQAKAAE